jgi:thiol-disulfide isomerase/thioredoxin
VRTRVGVALVTVCLGLAGCSLFGKKQTAQNAHPKPFLGSETPASPREASVAATPGGPLPGANGLLAGQVVDTSTGKPVKAAIEVKDLEEDVPKAAALDVETKEDGYFTILGVKPGHHYKLIARAKEGGELASGTVFVIPPKPNLFIRINRQFTTPDTPPVPDPPKAPGKKATPGTESGQERTPATSLDPPVKIAPSGEGTTNPSSGSGIGAGQGGNPPNIANVAEGFNRIPRDPAVNIPPPPGQYNTTPWPSSSPPQWEGIPDDRRQQLPSPQIAPAAPSSPIHLPTQPTKVPSCVLLGNRLDNFALNDVDGQRWEYKRDHRGRLVLLDFWHTSCGACFQAIPHLVDLQRSYGPYGLQVVGIACETGPLEEQRRRVLAVRGRYHINYTTLLSGGGFGNCPVMGQFQADYFPMLVLLDENGRILWRSGREGMDDYAHETLRRLIEKRLLANQPR